jgi:sterol desaturase/sphingolipid hydroxylase (fatty acid hydroxylase superfamily)
MHVVRAVLLEALFVYAIIGGLYLLVGVVLWRFANARVPKIQDRRCPPALAWRDFKQSLASLGTISLLFGGGTYLHDSGIGLASFDDTPLNIAWSFVASLLVFDTWFYWGHRLLHTKLLYRRIHQWHHVAVTPTVWSNNSDKLLDNCVLQSYWLLVHFILPISPLVLLAHKIYDQVTGMFGHSGHEYSPKPIPPLIGVAFHDRHHERFTCNYATHFSIWDHLMATTYADLLSQRQAKRPASPQRRWSSEAADLREFLRPEQPPYP